jgi:hypothetical protein
MGSIARGNRCDRFIKEFNDDVVKFYDVPVSDGGPFVRIGLSIHDVFEQVFLYVTVKLPTGEYELMFDDIIFDPEGLCVRDLVASVMPYCHDHASEARQRLVKAELIDAEEAEDDAEENP